MNQNTSNDKGGQSYFTFNNFMHLVFFVLFVYIFIQCKKTHETQAQLQDQDRRVPQRASIYHPFYRDR